MKIEEFSAELVEGLLLALGKKPVSIILYGSVARGDNTEESDVDVAIIVSSKLSDSG